MSAIPDAPTVSLSSTTTSTSSSIVVSGTTEKYANIIITGGVGQTTTPADGYGSFCTLYSLNSGKNVLSITAQRSDGSTSDATQKTVNYNAGTTTSTRAASTADVAVFKTPGTDTGNDGVAKITDDDDTTYTTFTDYPSVYIDLGATYQVSDIEIVFPGTSSGSDGSYADQYDVLTSTVDAPTRPVTKTTATWTLLDSVEGEGNGNGDGGSDTFSLATPVSARWIAIDVTHNQIWYSWTVKIASIRVYGTKVSSGSTGGGSGSDNTIASCQ